MWNLSSAFNPSWLVLPWIRPGAVGSRHRNHLPWCCCWKGNHCLHVLKMLSVGEEETSESTENMQTPSDKRPFGNQAWTTRHEEDTLPQCHRWETQCHRWESNPGPSSCEAPALGQEQSMHHTHKPCVDLMPVLPQRTDWSVHQSPARKGELGAWQMDLNTIRILWSRSRLSYTFRREW